MTPCSCDGTQQRLASHREKANLWSIVKQLHDACLATEIATWDHLVALVHRIVQEEMKQFKGGRERMHEEQREREKAKPNLVEPSSNLDRPADRAPARENATSSHTTPEQHVANNVSRRQAERQRAHGRRLAQKGMGNPIVEMDFGILKTDPAEAAQAPGGQGHDAQCPCAGRNAARHHDGTRARVVDAKYVTHFQPEAENQ